MRLVYHAASLARVLGSITGRKNLHLYSIKNDRKTTMVISMATICIGENKGAGICRADQCLCFRYKDSTIIFFFLNTKFQDSASGSAWPAFVTVQAGL